METATTTTRRGTYTVNSIGWTQTDYGHAKLFDGVVVHRVKVYTGRKTRTHYTLAGTGGFVTRVADISGLVARHGRRAA